MMNINYISGIILCMIPKQFYMRYKVIKDMVDVL